MSIRAVFILLLFLYGAVIIPFTGYLKNRPLAIKLGYTPEAEMLKIVSGDQRYAIAEYTIVKVLFYYGTLVEKLNNKIAIPPEYYNMYKTLETAVKLDPYNMDAYYFVQAAFTWEINRIQDVNKMLIYGMKYRTWDPDIPFYVGFNYAYFLKDYANGAQYMKKGAEISGHPLMINLAARYFYEARQDDLGILFLNVMETGAKDKSVRNLYSRRKKALFEVKKINNAVMKFKTVHKRLPADLNELITSGTMSVLPQDPYGGRFYIAEGGMIRSTSKFAFGGQTK